MPADVPKSFLSRFAVGAARRQSDIGTSGVTRTPHALAAIRSTVPERDSSGYMARTGRIVTLGLPSYEDYRASGPPPSE